jgi:hypothetical protein
MKKKMLLIAALCLLSTNVALATRHANGMVTIQTDPQFLQLNSRTLSDIIYSPAVAYKAVKSVLNVDMGSAEITEIMVFDRTDRPIHNNTFPCRIQILLPNNEELPPVAEELLIEVTILLRITIEEAYADFMAQKSKKPQALQANIQEAKNKWGALNNSYAEFIKTKTIPHKNIPQYISELTEEVEGELLDIETNKRFLKEASKYLNEMESKLKKQVGDDPIIKQLSKLVEISAAELKVIQDLKKNPDTIVTGLEEAEKNLLMAQIELAKRQEQLHQQSQPELADLSKRIANTSIEIPLIEIRYALLSDRLERAKASLEYSHEYETLKLERAYAEKNVQQAMREYQKSMENINQLSPPTVVSIGIN